MTSRGRLRFFAGLIAILVTGIVILLLLHSPATVTATVTVSEDGRSTVTAYDEAIPLSGADASAPLVTAEIPLDRWEGELVRVDIQTRVSRRVPILGKPQDVGCSAQLTGPDGSRQLDLAGWPRDASRPWHVSAAGPSASRLVGEDGTPVFFAANGHFWHVLRVPPNGRLEVSLRSVGRTSGPRQENVSPDAGVGRQVAAPAGDSDVSRPDVFIYLIDALRADHLGCYGYDRNTSPAMDAFASGATFFEDANTAATWTRPSVATVMTGLYPSVHGAMHITEALAEWPVLLPEMLSRHGYATWTVTTNGHTTEKWGFKQGYDGMVYGNMESAGWVNEQVATILSDLDPDEPVFMFLHTIEPHAPYAPEGKSLELFDRGFDGSCDGSLEALDALGGLNPDLSREDVEHLIDRYDADVFEADKGFSGFLDILRRFHRFDNALVILLSDHGESFMDHDTLQHSCNLNQEELHVPLIVHFPHGRFGGLRVRQRASLVDILPTILSEVGIAPEVWYPLPGLDLATLAAAPTGGASRAVYAEVSWHEANHLDLVAVIDEDGYKRTLDVSVDPGEFATTKSLGLWDTASDPKEQHDLSSSMPVRAAYDEQLLAEWLRKQAECRTALAEAPATVEITDEMREELQALGYLR